MSAVTPGKTAASPVFVGVALGLVIRASAEGPGLFVDGGYRLARADADRLKAVPAQRAVILSAQTAAVSATWTLWADQPSFEDDEDRGPSTVEGYFRVDLLDRFPLDPGETCYVIASMGTWLSNVVTVLGR